MINIIAVFIGGGLGSLARFGISIFIFDKFKTIFPLATLISNALSCFILAVAILFFGDRLGINTNLRMLVLTGFCGGFSTFSAFSFETVELFRSGNTLYGLANILMSVGLCIVLILLLTKNN